MSSSDDLSDMFGPHDLEEPLEPEFLRLFEIARAEPTANELSAEHDIVNAMALAIQSSNVTELRRAPMHKRFSSAKHTTKAAIIAGVVLFSTSAAAAAGVLPDGAQSAVARAADHAGLSLPNPDARTNPVPAVDTTTSTTEAVVEEDTSTTTKKGDAADPAKVADPTADAAVGPDATGPAKAGLCQAWTSHQMTHANNSANNSANDSANDSVAMKNLQTAADAAGQTVVAFCAVTTPNTPSSHDPSGNDHGPSATPGKPDSAGKSADHRKDDRSGAPASSTVSGSAAATPSLPPQANSPVTLPPQSNSPVTLPSQANPEVTLPTQANGGGHGGHGHP